MNEEAVSLLKFSEMHYKSLLNSVSYRKREQRYLVPLYKRSFKITFIMADICRNNQT
jgi:hypothetical protein